MTTIVIDPTTAAGHTWRWTCEAGCGTESFATFADEAEATIARLAHQAHCKGAIVRFLQCPLCPVNWTLAPPWWLGSPWTREEADGLLTRHMDWVHADTQSGRQP